MSNAQPGTTNEEAPFEPGEIIEWGGPRFVVLTNNGKGGEVHPIDRTKAVYATWGSARRTGERVDGK